MSHSGVDTPPPVHSEGRSRVEAERLSKELRQLADAIEKSSPVPAGRSSLSPPRSGRRGFLGTSSTANKIHLPWSNKKKGHRKSKSLMTGAERGAAYLLERPSPIAAKATSTATTQSHSPKVSPNMSPMIQELWSVQQDASIVEALSMPTLSKPRATSFLTGKEVVRTSEIDATEWQTMIPEKVDFEVAAAVSAFVEHYREEECFLDLALLKGLTRMQLREFAEGNATLDQLSPVHRPLVESLLDCGEDIVGVAGHVMSDHPKPHHRRECLMIERQRQLLVVMRGTKAEQQRTTGNKSQQMAALCENDPAEVLADRLAALADIEADVFQKLDELTEENPFCDIVFAGHSFGAAMAMLGAYRYALARPELRVGALVTGCPVIGDEDFRRSVHSLPNLKAIRVELGATPRHVHHGVHAGHTIRIALSQMPPIKAYRFSDCQEANLRSLFKTREREIADYINAYHELGGKWVTDYYHQDGVGVIGTDNEVRRMA